MQTTSDEDLMMAYRYGDARAFEDLYQRHKGPVYRYLLRQCRNAAIAEELFQDTWLGLIRARERYEPRAKFTTYLYRLAHNHLIDHYRRQSSVIPLSYTEELDDLPGDASYTATLQEPVNDLDTRRQVRQLLTLIENLPDAQREVFLLREESGLSLEEIANATGVNVETAKSRLRYAMTKLRAGMAEKNVTADERTDELTPPAAGETGSW
jgi:RNA polymerase sigma-70 factor, ECF subfamily